MYLQRSEVDEIQLDLFGDYASNVALYPAFQAYFREHQPRLLAIWGRNDPFFLSPGAEAYRRDLPRAEVRFLDTGHFALETHGMEIAEAIAGFLLFRPNDQVSGPGKRIGYAALSTTCATVRSDVRMASNSKPLSMRGAQNPTGAGASG